MSKTFVYTHKFKTCEALANRIVDIYRSAIHENGICSIALSGGSTPRILYELMAQPPYINTIEWNNVFFFWSDERWLPATDPNNNSNMAYEALLKKVPVPAENIFPVLTINEPADAAKKYEEQIQQFFNKRLPSFDIILLGLGDNGHTASLFPYTEILHEKYRLVKEVFVEEVKSWRISFTAPLINNAAHTLFLVTGKEKSPIINTIFSGESDTEQFPALLINPSNTEWFLDAEAASLLPANK